MYRGHFPVAFPSFGYINIPSQGTACLTYAGPAALSSRDAFVCVWDFLAPQRSSLCNAVRLLSWLLIVLALWVLLLRGACRPTYPFNGKVRLNTLISVLPYLTSFEALLSVFEDLQYVPCGAQFGKMLRLLEL